MYKQYKQAGWSDGEGEVNKQNRFCLALLRLNQLRSDGAQSLNQFTSRKHRPGFSSWLLSRQRLKPRRNNWGLAKEKCLHVYAEQS